jgi:hypothetical protein
MVVDDDKAIAEVGAGDPPPGSASIDRSFTVTMFDRALNGAMR